MGKSFVTFDFFYVRIRPSPPTYMHVIIRTYMHFLDLALEIMFLV